MSRRAEAHPDEDTILAAVIQDAPIPDQLSHPFQTPRPAHHTGRQITHLEREQASLHETANKLRYECLELARERALLKEKLEIRARVDVVRAQYNNATWIRRAWVWIGARLGMWL